LFEALERHVMYAWDTNAVLKMKLSCGTGVTAWLLLMIMDLTGLVETPQAAI